MRKAISGILYILDDHHWDKEVGILRKEFERFESKISSLQSDLALKEKALKDMKKLVEKKDKIAFELSYKSLTYSGWLRSELGKDGRLEQLIKREISAAEKAVEERDGKDEPT